MSILDEPVWSRCSIALTCPARSHFQRTLNREKRGWGKDEDSYHQEKEKNEERIRATEKQEKREDRRPILENMCVLPFCDRSRGSTAKKWFVRRCPG